APFTDGPRIEDARPGQAQIALRVLLISLLADDHVLGIANLTRPLIASDERVVPRDVPVHPAGVILVGEIEGRDTRIRPFTSGIVRRQPLDPIEDRLDPRTIRRRIVAARQPRPS